jgi:subtilisin-like proprotein convertase family protein
MQKTKYFIYLLFLLSLVPFYSNTYAQRYWNVAAKFDGNGYVSVAPWSGLNNLNGSFTVECWFNAETGGTLFGKDGLRLLLDKNSAGRVVGRMQTNNLTKIYSTSAGMSLNKWYHLACVYNSVSNQMQFYINGVLDTSASVSNAAPLAGTDSLFMGKSAYGYYKGMLDDIRIWNRALTASEIIQNMRNPYVGSLNYNHNFGTGLLLSTSFDFSYCAGGSSLYFWDGLNDYKNNGASAVLLGDEPSQTLAINNALDLTGGGYLVMPNNADIAFNGPMSMEAWVYPTTVDGNSRYIIAKKAGWNDPGYSIYYSIFNSTPSIRYKNNASGLISSIPVPLNQWTHIATTISQTGEAKIYVNGQLDQQYPGMPLPGDNTDSLYIGTIKGAAAENSFTGYIDAVNISNYEKSEQEIKKDMFKIIDYSNQPTPPNSTVALNFDFFNYSNTGKGSYYYYMGNAKSTSPGYESVPVAPLMGNNNYAFPLAYTIKSSNRRIPEFNTAGYMKEDSILITKNLTINDVKLFLGLNHAALADLEIKLFSPSGDSAIIARYPTGVNNRITNITTIFDDAANASITQSYVDFGPVIKPYSSLNSAFSGKNSQGVWRIKITDYNNGNTGFLYGWGLNFNNITTDVKEVNSGELPRQYTLSQNYPNPFNPSTVIRYSLPYESNVKVSIYNMLGQKLETLVDGINKAGNFEVNFNASRYSSGVYFYTIEASSLDKTHKYRETKKMMLVK